MRGEGNQHGFTLLELLISLILLALIAGIVYGGLSVSLKMWQSGEAKAEEYQRLRVGLNQLLEEIRSAYPATIKPEDSLDPAKDNYIAFWGESDRLRFVTNTAGLIGEPINNWPRTMEYHADSDKGLLMREVVSYYHDCFAQLEKEDTITLDPEISQIKFRYYFVPEKKDALAQQSGEPVRGEWYDTWDPTSVDPMEKVDEDKPNPRKSLPDAVEVTLTLKPKTPYDDPLTLPPMVVPIYCKQKVEAPDDQQTHQ